MTALVLIRVPGSQRFRELDVAEGERYIHPSRILAWQYAPTDFDRLNMWFDSKPRQSEATREFLQRCETLWKSPAGIEN